MPEREQPQQTYYVGARATLVVRFEEFGAGGAPEPPAVPPQLRKGAKPVIDRLHLRTDDQGRLELELPGSQPGGPQKQWSSSDGRTQPIAGIVPRRASLQRNGIREADTLELEFAFVDMPVDPRVVRSCAVELYLGCLPEQQWEQGLRGAAPGQGGQTEAVPLSVLPAEYVDAAGRARTNLRFQGWVDDWEVEFGEDQEGTVRLTCTDNTRLLIEQDAPPGLQAQASVPLDRAIAEYLSNFPQYAGLVVEYRPAGQPVPTLRDVLAPTAQAKEFGPPPAGGAGAGKLSVWDYLTDLAGSVGHVVFFDGRSIVLQRPRTLYAGQFLRPDDPFTGRVLPSRTISRRLYVYGRNVEELSFRRKFARHAPSNVEVRCYAPRRKKTLIARYPQKGERQKRVSPGQAADQKWHVVTVWGVEDEAALRAVAQDVYEGLGRQELEVGFTTRSLGSFGGGNLDPDALDVRPGDAVDVEVNREGLEGLSSPTVVEGQVAERAEAFLRHLGYSQEFAAAYRQAVSNIGYPTTFRVRAMVVDWDADEGAVLRFECVNYVEARQDAALPAGEEPELEASATAQPVQVDVGGPA